ncbi:Heme-binding 2 [Micractinium conductrix]|uniref:Heme-binding 2 n=1 Tax=Micractinium conductrix TaxID=554055 RepID=A0A2P6VDD5_9CHLO|nr:Heme-binding 2 [Micractinium conductrix]|eukprot:PSC72087.1 Heme-binding 2 [Micractinium conductrix]
MRAAAALLLLSACLGACQALDLLDPAGLVETLSTGGAGLERWKRPDFCGELDCPPYKVEKKKDNYELRRYNAGKWLQTQVNDTKFELAYTKAASRLTKYFKGGNEEERSYKVTTPTLVELKLVNEGKGTEQSYNFSLWLPEEIQKEPPQPTDAELQIIDYPKIKVYVRKFSGFATEGTILKEANGFMDILDDEGREDYGEEIIWVAIYDPPQKLMHRHNEIHLPAGQKKKKQQAEQVLAS